MPGTRLDLARISQVSADGAGIDPAKTYILVWLERDATRTTAERAGLQPYQ